MAGAARINLACEKAASPPVIQLILDDYPEATRVMASNGETPLHVARPRIEDTLTETLKHLIGGAPGALDVVDHDADTPLNKLLRSLKR
jgi:hypothetical protein